MSTNCLDFYLISFTLYHSFFQLFSSQLTGLTLPTPIFIFIKFASLWDWPSITKYFACKRDHHHHHHLHRHHPADQQNYYHDLNTWVIIFSTLVVNSMFTIIIIIYSQLSLKIRSLDQSSSLDCYLDFNFWFSFNSIVIMKIFLFHCFHDWLINQMIILWWILNHVNLLVQYEPWKNNKHLVKYQEVIRLIEMLMITINTYCSLLFKIKR